MKLTTDSIKKFQNAEHNFGRLEKMFRDFVEELVIFGKPDSLVKGIVIDTSAGEHRIVARYKTAEIHLRLMLQLSLQGIPFARVVCTMKEQLNDKCEKVLGQFTFHPNGKTDVLDASGSEVFEIESYAPDILLHFIYLALQQSSDEPPHLS